MTLNKEIILNVPPAVAWRSLMNLDKLIAAEPSIVSHKVVAGGDREEGTKTIYTAEHKGGTVEVTETIFASNKPKEFMAGYRTEDYYASLKITFSPEGETTHMKTDLEIDLDGVSAIFSSVAKTYIEPRLESELARFKQITERSDA